MAASTAHLMIVLRHLCAGLGWLPVRSLQGEELLQHQGGVDQHAEDCFDAEEDEEIIELRQQLVL